MHKIIAITGQTATGKTKLALQLAKQYDGELINFDSRQIYKKLDIITGKDLPANSEFHKKKSLHNFDIGFYFLPPTPYTLNPIKIWLYDIVEPSQYFSSFDYQTCAIEVIKDILKRNKTPILVGGTYFYLHHLLYEVQSEQIKPDWNLRKKLEEKSVQELQQELLNLNKDMFSELNESDRQNPRRLIRRIEIAEYDSHSGKHFGQLSVNSSASRDPGLSQDDILNNVILGRRVTTTPESSSHSDENNTPNEKLSQLLNLSILQIDFIGLKHSSKEILTQAIEKRVKDRIKQGAYEEVKILFKKYKPTDPGLKTIGYQQIIQFLQGKIAEKDMKKIWILKELQYAKRQYTFMKKNPHIKWNVYIK